MTTNVAPYFSDDWLTIYGGDCREVLASMPGDSVDCVVTSPPYWGLRDYGTATWEGGEAECDHKETVYKQSLAKLADKWAPNATPRNPNRADDGQIAAQYRHTCGLCGAIRQDSQLGLERTPDEYVANMVVVFAEVRRVLKPSGTCWLNLGDSYAHGTTEMPLQRGTSARPSDSARFAGTVGERIHGLKPKDLVGIPWRVAFALQADGWYLRSDIIWSKPNPMPESVTDRPTKAHEYLFLLTKSARYYFDADAVRESAIYEGVTVKASNPDTAKNGAKGKYGATAFGFTQHDTVVAGRNIRSVWNIATRPYPGAHFAVFPPELPERCIKAGSPTLGTVLDPFAGSGTVGMVANRLSRRAILIDLNPEYLKQQMKRNVAVPLGL